MTAFQKRRNHFFTFVLLFLTIHIQTGYSKNGAFFPPSLKNLQVSAAGGADWYSRHDTHLMISPYETDSDKVQKVSAHGAWKIGLDYPLFDTLPHFNKLLLSLNVYQTSTTLQGAVWQYQLPQFNNYHFKAPLTSTRLMFDLKPGFTWRTMEPYAIVGIGAAWNALSYKETVTAVDVESDSSLVLSQHTNAHLAWDFGLGYRAALNEKLHASVEYIYAILGHASPLNDPDGVRLTTAPRFSLQSQTLLFGLSLRI